jgi:hypothetical protein
MSVKILLMSVLTQRVLFITLDHAEPSIPVFGFEFGVRSIFSYMEFLASSRSKILSRLLDFLSIPP